MDTLIVTAFILSLTLAEGLAGAYFDWRRDRKDWIINLLSVANLAILVKPAIILASGYLLSKIVPGQQGALAHIPLWLGVLLILVPDELLHYLYHRMAHEWPWLWKLHRTHHTQTKVNVYTTFRVNFWWFVFMPNLWYSAAFVYFGLGEAYVISNILIACVDVANHNSLGLDEKLLRHRVLGPVVRAVGKVFTLPLAHAAHHGIGEHSQPMGNYSTLLFVFDTVLRTGRLPEGRPERFGVDGDTDDPWHVQVFWPVFVSSDPRSEWHRRW